MLHEYFPQRVNSGVWAASYTLNHLRSLPEETTFILPVCSIGTPYAEIAQLGEFILPPLFHEALTAQLQQDLIRRIVECFPYFQSDMNASRIQVVEKPRVPLPVIETPRVLAFSVDTAVEEHGPHLPLGTDTIQSYGVLDQLASECEGFELARPLEYGQLTWGLPFGFSVDITCPLLTEYVTGYCNALQDWQQPAAMYVVDVHGSITHRQAIVDGLKASRVQQWAFRWLHDPLPEYASSRGDQHAGGVETILVELINSELLDSHWWPERLEEIAAGQMSFTKAVELTPHLAEFCQYVNERHPNGVIGDIQNYKRLDGAVLFKKVLDLARSDVQRLLAGETAETQHAGQNLW